MMEIENDPTATERWVKAFGKLAREQEEREASEFAQPQQLSKNRQKARHHPVEAIHAKWARGFARLVK